MPERNMIGLNGLDYTKVSTIYRWHPWIRTGKERDYILLDRISSGGFGAVYKGICSDNPKEMVAVKLSDHHNREAREGLEYEHFIYQQLTGASGIKQGFPRIHYYGAMDDFNDALVMDLLGDDLRTMMKKQPSGCLPIKQVLEIAMSSFALLYECHSRNILHRDIKPANMAYGRGSAESQLHFVDFGLACRDKLPDGKSPSRHEPIGRLTCGTRAFASLGAHTGRVLERRDDLESLAYTLIFLAKGSLPWHSNSFYSEYEDDIRELKSRCDIDTEICAGLPKMFGRLLRYARSLQSGENPDLKRLDRNFRLVYKAYGYDKIKPNVDDHQECDAAFPSLAINPWYLEPREVDIFHGMSDPAMRKFFATRYIQEAGLGVDEALVVKDHIEPAVPFYVPIQGPQRVDLFKGLGVDFLRKEYAEMYIREAGLNEDDATVLREQAMIEVPHYVSVSELRKLEMSKLYLAARPYSIVLF